MKSHHLSILLFALLAMLSGLCKGEVGLATPFSDGMVLQRGMKVPVWGKCGPMKIKREVTVAFAGQEKTALLHGPSGSWRVDLDPMEASCEPRTMTVTVRTYDGFFFGSSKETVEIKDVLVGEVWMAAGQSNMECPIWGPNPRYRDEKGSMMISMTRKPTVRFAKMKKVIATEPKTNAAVTWRPFMPESFGKDDPTLSAVAFYYALELNNALGIPVGIVDTSWGGTIIDAWTPRSAYAMHPELKDVAEMSVVEKDQWKSSMKHGVFTDARQQPSVLWNGMTATWAGYGCRGVIWYQGCQNNPEAKRYTDKMHALYDGWSKEFENPDLKLYFVLLAPYSTDWFELQMSQLKFASEEKNAALSVVADHGNMADIHPNNKEIVAKRLALHALKRDYGFTEIEDESPTLESCTVANGEIQLTFSHAKGLYVYNPDRSPNCGFTVTTKDGREHAAKIVKNVGNTLTIKPVKAKGEIVRVSYLRKPPYFGALYSDAALPVAPFDSLVISR